MNFGQDVGKAAILLPLIKIEKLDLLIRIIYTGEQHLYSVYG